MAQPKKRRSTDPLESSFEIRRRLSSPYGLTPEDAALVEPEEEPVRRRPPQRHSRLRLVVTVLLAVTFGGLAVWQLIRGVYVLAGVSVVVGALAVFFYLNRYGDDQR